MRPNSDYLLLPRAPLVLARLAAASAGTARRSKLAIHSGDFTAASHRRAYGALPPFKIPRCFSLFQ